MNTKTVTVTFQNVPGAEYDEVWQDLARFVKRTSNRIVKPTDNMTIDFNKLTSLSSFTDAISEIMAEYAILTATETKNNLS